MGRFLPYEPDQAYLVPPSVKDELGEDHLCFFIHRAVEHMDLKRFEQVYGEEGGALYCPALMLKVWLYAYAVGITSARRLEQRIREDLGLRYLAGGARPDNWALSAFRRRHARGLNDVFTQVLEMARGLKLGRLGQVAIDSTRIHAAASRNRLETEERLRQERSRLRRSIRKWQKLCDEDDPNEGAGTRVHLEKLPEQLQEMPRRLEKLRKSGMKKLSRTDEDARFLRTRAGERPTWPVLRREWHRLFPEEMFPASTAPPPSLPAAPACRHWPDTEREPPRRPPPALGPTTLATTATATAVGGT